MSRTQEGVMAVVKRVRDYVEQQAYYDPDNVPFRSFLTEAADLLEQTAKAEPVAWRAKAQCGMYVGMWEFSEDKSDLINPEPLYATPIQSPTARTEK